MILDPAAVAATRTLREAGLPPWYQPDGFEQAWLGAISLPATAALCARAGRDTHPLAELGTLEVDEVPVQVETDGRWPSEIQFLNWRWLVAVDAELAPTLLDAVFAAYPTIRATFSHLSDEVRGRVLPDIPTPDALRPLVGLTSLVLHAVPHAATPYLGAVFTCAWDEEHGLGVLLHGTTVLATGDADTALDGARARAHRAAVLEALQR